VQVVESSRSGEKVTQRIVRYMGIELDAEGQTKLRATALFFITRRATRRLNLAFSRSCAFQAMSVTSLGNWPAARR
jgi:hypothetical protein